jgi:hypothetical protein
MAGVFAPEDGWVIPSVLRPFSGIKLIPVGGFQPHSPAFDPPAPRLHSTSYNTMEEISLM